MNYATTPSGMHIPPFGLDSYCPHCDSYHAARDMVEEEDICIDCALESGYSLCSECGALALKTSDDDLCAKCEGLVVDARQHPGDMAALLSEMLEAAGLYADTPLRWVEARLRAAWPCDLGAAYRAALRHTFEENEKLADEMGVGS